LFSEVPLRFLALWAAKHAFLSGSSLKTEVFRDAHMEHIQEAGMRKGLLGAAILAVFAGAVFSEPRDAQIDPVKEKEILRLDTGNRMVSDDIQKMFTALTISYLKTNNSYILAHEIFRDPGRQNLSPSLVLTELDYGTFTIINIRYSFSNGYFEFKLARLPFTNIVNDEVVYSVDYDGKTGGDLYKTINDKLQEAVYISRGYAAMHRKKSSASFYLFR
jgi:hypothetical protein